MLLNQVDNFLLPPLPLCCNFRVNIVNAVLTILFILQSSLTNNKICRQSIALTELLKLVTAMSKNLASNVSWSLNLYNCVSHLKYGPMLFSYTVVQQSFGCSKVLLIIRVRYPCSIRDQSL